MGLNEEGGSGTRQVGIILSAIMALSLFRGVAAAREKWPACRRDAAARWEAKPLCKSRAIYLYRLVRINTRGGDRMLRGSWLFNDGGAGEDKKEGWRCPEA